ncbi:MAG: helix-turn-helix transcriptional regulator [Kofleriaceae bacterium]|nr:helix-turn-helix transcriptional regulator [Kofleriaceae bacterium]
MAPNRADVEAVFLALSHEARRHIIVMLSHLGGELPSGYLASKFKHSWPTTTRHLKVLEDAGIVEVRREGRSAHYRLVRTKLAAVVGGWLAHLEPVGPERTWTSSGPKSTRALEARATARPKPARSAKSNRTSGAAPL